VRAAADAYLAQRRAETEFDAVWHEAAPPLLRAVATEALAECESAAAAARDEAARVDALHRGDAALRGPAFDHVVRLATLRHLVSRLGASPTSLLVHRFLILEATAGVVDRLDQVSRAVTEPRKRLEAEPLLADAFNVVCAQVGFEKLALLLGAAIDADEEDIDATEEATYGAQHESPPAM